MPVQWSKVSPDVIAIAVELISFYHPHLEDARIAFIFRSEPQQSGDHLVLGQASKVADKLKSLMPYDFIIWIARPNYDAMREVQQKALIDHELCHCVGDKVIGWSIKRHDIEEFQDIIDRYGLWSANLRSAASVLKQAVEQVRLPFEIAKELKEDMAKVGVVVALEVEQVGLVEAVV